MAKWARAPRDVPGDRLARDSIVTVAQVLDSVRVELARDTTQTLVLARRERRHHQRHRRSARLQEPRAHRHRAGQSDDHVSHERHPEHSGEHRQRGDHRPAAERQQRHPRHGVRDRDRRGGKPASRRTACRSKCQQIATKITISGDKLTPAVRNRHDHGGSRFRVPHQDAITGFDGRDDAGQHRRPGHAAPGRQLDLPEQPGRPRSTVTAR